MTETGKAANIETLLAAHRPGHALVREFSTDPAIYATDLDVIWRQDWLFAAHSCELRDPGDYITIEVDTDSVIVIRDRSGRLRGLRNTCRHRGMRILEQPCGHVDRLVCRYHQWVYDLDGRLQACGGMDRDDDLDVADYPLRTASVREVGGLVFISLGADPPPFEDARATFEQALAPQGLTQAKIVAQRSYVIEANWKLVWENNRECWHCHLGHPQYVKANYDTAPMDSTRTVELAARRGAELAARLADQSTVDHRRPGLAEFPHVGVWWSANRTPLAEGFVTESIDGRPVAPLMGRYREADVGTLRLRTLPNFWCHASSDHAVTTRLLPAGVGHTRAVVSWLVDQDAVENVDYDLERLLPFWQLTSEQDWDLCTRNQRGVRDSAFSPGPYSRRREYNLIAWVEWYIDRIAAARTGH